MGTDKKIARENEKEIVWIDESGFMLQPVVRRTWAPIGETPIHYSWDRHDRISACAAIKVGPDFKFLQVFFELWQRNIKSEEVLGFLKQIHQETGKKLIVILDRWNGHRKAIRLLLEEKVDWLQVEWLPAYAPELNPVEQLWGHTKYGDLANYIPEDIQVMQQSVTHSIRKAANNSDLLLSFVRHTHLDLV